MVNSCWNRCNYISIFNGCTIIPLYTEIFSEGYWEVLTTPGSLAYDPLWAPILTSEIAVNAGLIIALLYMIFLFFSKKIFFPKYYIGILLFTLVFMVADMLVLKAVLPNEPMLDPETTKGFMGTSKNDPFGMRLGV